MTREVIFLRHGKKTSAPNVADMDQQLVPGAIDELRDRLSTAGLLSGTRIARHSLYRRTRDTAVGIVDGGTVVEDPSLGIDMKSMFSGAQLTVWKEQAAINENGNIQRFLDHVPNESDSTWSSYRIACGLAQSLLHSVEESAHDADHVTEFKVTHSGYIEALLKHLAEEAINIDPVVKDQATFVARIGGILQMSDMGVSFDIGGDASTPAITLKLRGHTYLVDSTKLRKMAEYYQTLGTKA